MSVSPWLPADTAPKTGDAFLALIGSCEQGFAEVDVVCWGSSEYLADPCWCSGETFSGCKIIYSHRELGGWMPIAAST